MEFGGHQPIKRPASALCRVCIWNCERRLEDYNRPFCCRVGAAFIGIRFQSSSLCEVILSALSVQANLFIRLPAHIYFSSALIILARQVQSRLTDTMPRAVNQINVPGGYTHSSSRVQSWEPWRPAPAKGWAGRAARGPPPVSWSRLEAASSADGTLPSAVPSEWNRAGWLGTAAGGFFWSNSALALPLHLEPLTKKL